MPYVSGWIKTVNAYTGAVSWHYTPDWAGLHTEYEELNPSPLPATYRELEAEVAAGKSDWGMDLSQAFLGWKAAFDAWKEARAVWEQQEIAIRAEAARTTEITAWFQTLQHPLAPDTIQVVPLLESDTAGPVPAAGSLISGVQTYYGPQNTYRPGETNGNVLVEPTDFLLGFYEVNFGIEFESSWVPYVVLRQEFEQQIRYLFDILGPQWEQVIYNTVENLVKLEFSISPAADREGNWVGGGIDFEQFLNSGLLVTLTFENNAGLVVSGIEFMEMIYGSEQWEILFESNLSKKPKDYRDGAYVVSSRPRTYMVRC